jgi:XTP/dITP diphosphohydrolase
MKIYFATTNAGKIKEFQEALKDVDIELIPVDVHMEEYQTDDMEAISRHKVMQVFEQLQDAVVVDDSGIYFDKYKNFPGVYAKPIIENLGFDGIKKLIDEGDGAYFQTVISYMAPGLSEPICFIGKHHGTLSLQDSTDTKEIGFPYNHLFKPLDDERFLYQIPIEERRNQRIRALEIFKEWLKEQSKI